MFADKKMISQPVKEATVEILVGRDSFITFSGKDSVERIQNPIGSMRQRRCRGF